MPMGVVNEKIFADLMDISNGAVEPDIFFEPHTASSDLDPSLSHPIA
jgi:hypothetical protein